MVGSSLRQSKPLVPVQAITASGNVNNIVGFVRTHTSFVTER